MNDVVLPRSCA